MVIKPPVIYNFKKHFLIYLFAKVQKIDMNTYVRHL